jgi:hypothetical protein
MANESTNFWRFVHSTPFQLLIDRPEFKNGITRNFNDLMRSTLAGNNIYNISFKMFDIQRSKTGYYFKFTLDYIDPKKVTFQIFREYENLHISFHQKTGAPNQTHISVTKNGISSTIPITFSLTDYLNVIINIDNIRSSLSGINLIPTELEKQYGITTDKSENLFQNIGIAFSCLSPVLQSVFEHMDILSKYFGYGPLMLRHESPGRQASTMAGGNKYIKYKFNFLYL